MDEICIIHIILNDFYSHFLSSFLSLPLIRQGELDGLMLQNPHLMHTRQQRHFITQQQQQQQKQQQQILSHSSGIQLPQPMQSHYHRQEHLHPSQQHLSSGADIQSKYKHGIYIASNDEPF